TSNRMPSQDNNPAERGEAPSGLKPALQIRSMTGYALVRSATSAGELTVSLRSVNHRGLDLHFHQSPELAVHENAIRAILKRHIARGHVEVRLSLARKESEAASYNRALLARYVSLFREAVQEFQLETQPDVNALFGLPGVLEAASESESPGNAFEGELLGAVVACASELNAHREREGGELCAGIERELSGIEEDTRQVVDIRREALAHFHQRLQERLKELIGSTIAEGRLAEEAALLADRSDVQEELTRLEVHTGEVRRILASGGERGKRLDFLLQEMNRETNTMLSKTSGIGEAGLTITRLGLALKAKIEKIREQALNLE
ncbi:MAG: YicC/YloC family endoribonuclease, partial [Bryobacteraceae bacterium]